MTKLKLHGYPTLYNFFDGEIPSSEKIAIDWRGVKNSTIQSKCRKKHLILYLFSCKDTALQILMSVSLSVFLSIIKLKFYQFKSYPRITKITQGLTQGYRSLCKGYPRFQGVLCACMQFHELTCRYISLHAGT